MMRHITLSLILPFSVSCRDLVDEEGQTGATRAVAQRR
jgi:hypothetical protein